ncbi:MAG: hypothetical protein L6R38_009346 [Xanthoria sp. 2 TBL-2021]|nr:MAG: hypothetical protein L6R38_009346 [Xanthoria sp. 2 TBL-2021]
MTHIRSGKKELLAAMSTTFVEGDLEYIQFVDMMHQKLSQELVDMIEHFTFEALFCPDIIGPRASQPPSRLIAPSASPDQQTAFSSQVQETARSELLCPSKHGPQHDRFLNDLPSKIRDQIRKIWVKASISDHEEQHWAELVPGTVTLKVNDQGNTAEVLSIVNGDENATDLAPINSPTTEMRREIASIARTNLPNTWWQNIDDVCMLPSLSKWVLDLSECYGPDGEFLGSE